MGTYIFNLEPTATFTEAGNSLGRQDSFRDATAEDDAFADDQDRESGVEGLPDGQGQAGDGEQRGEVDGGESREDTFFRNLSEHFSAQARR